MTYFVYFLFAIWYLSALGNLAAGALILFGPPEATRLSPKPPWFLITTAVYTLVVASILVWLYRTDVLSEWWILFAGSIVLLPEMIYFLRGRVVRK